MPRLRKNDNPSWQRPSLIVILIAGTITVFFLVAIVRQLFQSSDVRHELGRLRAQVSSEEQRQKQLKDLLTYLSSPTFQEQQARLDLGLKGPGEKVVIVPTNTNSTSPGSASGPAAVDDATSNPQKWWSYFFGS